MSRDNGAAGGAAPPLAGAPDTSFVIDGEVLAALGRLLDNGRMRRRWAAMPAESRRVHQAILRAFLATGAPPDAAGFKPEILEDLARRDLVHLREGRIALAYPFTAAPSGHVTALGDVLVHAVCAVDALGIPAMAGQDGRARSHCPLCGATITLVTADRGMTPACTAPAGARLWAAPTPIEGCAADSQCRTMRLFCSSDHLREWRDANYPGQEGFDLSPAQAVALGAAIFRPFLNPATWENDNP